MKRRKDSQWREKGQRYDQWTSAAATALFKGLGQEMVRYNSRLQPQSSGKGGPRLVTSSQGQTGLWSKTLSYKNDRELERQARAQGERSEAQGSLRCSERAQLRPSLLCVSPPLTLCFSRRQLNSTPFPGSFSSHHTPSFIALSHQFLSVMPVSKHCGKPPGHHCRRVDRNGGRGGGGSGGKAWDSGMGPALALLMVLVLAFLLPPHPGAHN